MFELLLLVDFVRSKWRVSKGEEEEEEFELFGYTPDLLTVTEVEDAIQASDKYTCQAA